MTHRSIIRLGVAVLAASGAARSAQATLFSFASDMNSNAFTFGGTAGTAGTFSVTDFSRPNTYMLLIDDNNGPLPTLSLPIEFHAALTASGGTSTLESGTLYRHNYLISGTFGFYSAGGAPLLTVTIPVASPGLLTVPGTANSWASSGAVIGSDTFSDVTYTGTPALITAMGGAAIAAQYGIVLGGTGNAVSLGPDDFGFTMTALNAGAVGLGVVIDPTTKAPTTTWRSESSFSGSATLNGVPAPSPAVLLGAGGLLSMGRRRNRR